MKESNVLKYFFALLVFLIPVMAFATDVKSDFDRDANLSSIRTFRFGDRSTGNLDDKRIRNGIRDAFAEVGVYETVGEPDVIVVYSAGISQKKRIQTSGFGRPTFWGVQSAWAEDYTEGTVVVAFLDAENGDLIWQGKVSGTVTLNNADRNTKEGMRRLANAFRKDRERQAKHR